MNAHELVARAIKVSAIVSNIPVGETRALNEAAARLLASWTQEERDLFAKEAGAKSPSPTTWAMVVEIVRTRPVPTMDDLDAHTRALPLLRVLAGGLTAGGGT